MKTKLGFLLLFVVLIGFVGCTKTEDDSVIDRESSKIDILQEHAGLIEALSKSNYRTAKGNRALGEAYLERAAARYRNGRFADALSDYNKLIKLETDWTFRAYEGRAYAKYALQDYAGAIDDVNEIVKRVGYNAYGIEDYLLLRGNAKLKLLDFKGAIADYTRALAENGYRTKPRFNRAYAKVKLKDYKGAIDDFIVAERYGAIEAHEILEAIQKKNEEKKRSQ